MQQAWLMQAVISADNMQIVSCLGIYQSILNPAVLQISKIGYCTMIEVPCTDFSAVCKVLKLAQWLVMFWNCMMQLSRLILPSSFKKNQIGVNFPEEFSNTVIRHRELLIALNYLSLLGKKFRFYLPALGNISLSDLIIFVTLSVFNDFKEFNLSIYKAVRSPVCLRNAARYGF